MNTPAENVVTLYKSPTYYVNLFAKSIFVRNVGILDLEDCILFTVKSMVQCNAICNKL